MKKFKIGHYTDLERGTGCSVVLCPPGTKASACARGVSPGTREFALLSPERKVEEVHALLLTGGSAFGLDAAAGVMQYLSERGVGYVTRFRKIPLVPAAVIYDLYSIDSSAYPTPENAYRACVDAKSEEPVQGCVGAGTGATVGKWAGLESMMKGGLGFAQISFFDLLVSAIAVVNPVGDVLDRNGQIIAGARREGKFIAHDNPEIRWSPPEVGLGENTVLAAVMTNAILTKMQLYYLAERSHNGIVRAVIPAHTSYDGDVVFSFSTGEIKSEIDTVTEISVEAVRQAILNGVRHARTTGGIPALQEN